MKQNIPSISHIIQRKNLFMKSDFHYHPTERLKRHHINYSKRISHSDVNILKFQKQTNKRHRRALLYVCVDIIKFIIN